MTENELIEWMTDYLDGDKVRQSALGMIMADVNQYGVQGFLDMPPETIISEYLVVTDELTQEAVEDFRALFNQEIELSELGVEQSFRINVPQTFSLFRDAMTDIMKSLLLYIEVQRMANAQYNNED